MYKLEIRSLPLKIEIFGTHDPDSSLSHFTEVLLQFKNEKNNCIHLSSLPLYLFDVNYFIRTFGNQAIDTIKRNLEDAKNNNRVLDNEFKNFLSNVSEENKLLLELL